MLWIRIDFASFIQRDIQQPPALLLACGFMHVLRIYEGGLDVQIVQGEGHGVCPCPLSPYFPLAAIVNFPHLFKAFASFRFLAKRRAKC